MVKGRQFSTIFLGLLIFTGTLVAVPMSLRWQPSDTNTAQPGRPNILLIVTDDQRYDTMEYMPRTKARIFDEGVTFSRAYATTPVCCPSRASILTGMQARNHHVLENSYPLQFPTFVEQLHANGYYTGLVGKYLNSWDGTPRPEFDSWVSLKAVEDDEGADPYFAPALNINGVAQPQPGYVTHILRDHAVSFLNTAAEQDKPFFLLFATNAPHAPAEAAPGDEDLYPDLAPHRPPSFNEADLSDKPEWLQGRDPASEKTIEKSDVLRHKQIQSLNAVDGAIDTLLSTLEAQGKYDNTLIFFLSDNGFLWGEHGLRDKRMPYEESIHIPFAIRYPPLIPEGRSEDRLVGNIDIAPTIYEVAGIPAPPQVDGRSLVSLLKGTQSWREELLIEGWRVIEDKKNKPSLNFTALRTDRYLYVESMYLENTSDSVRSMRNRPELYDLRSDPFQLENQVDNPAYAAVAAEHKEHLEALPMVVTVGGAREGVVQRRYPFSAIVSPITITEPITHTWEATDQKSVTHTGGIIDTIAFAWTTPGPKTVTVTSESGTTTVTHTYSMTIKP